MRDSLSRLLLITLVTVSGVACKSTASATAASLGVGAQAPDVTLPDQDGTPRSIASFQGQPLLLYFYPKDATPGCTTEACAFRDVWDRFAAANVAVVGVSVDDVASHKKFAEEHSLPFPLLSDTEAQMAEAFGVKTRMGMLPRVSFLIDATGTIRSVYPDVDPGVHASEVLRDVERLGVSGSE